MSESARDLKVLPATTTEGLEDLFDVEVDEGPAMARPLVADDQVMPLGGAAEMLGITRRSALRLIQEGKLAGAKDGHGQWQVKTDSIESRLQNKNQTASEIQQVAVEVADGHLHAWPGGQAEGQQEIMRELLSKMEALTYRNGYLESQLQERERDIEERDQQLKLLTDRQHKPGLWGRFKKWCAAQ